MAYVPKDAKWFLADMVEEIHVAGSKRNIIHINYVIIRANSPETAYRRAMSLGKRNEMSYKNTHGRKVTLRFRGLGNLDVIHDALGNGCEIMFREKLGVTEKAIRKMIRPKRKLEAFMPTRTQPGLPDYSSQEIMNKVAKRLKNKR